MQVSTTVVSYVMHFREMSDFCKYFIRYVKKSEGPTVSVFMNPNQTDAKRQNQDFGLYDSIEITTYVVKQ